MRLFIALNFDEKAKGYLAALQQEIKALSPSARLTALQNLHITLAFLGEADREQLPLITRAMKETPFTPTQLLFNRVGYFARDGGALFWAGLAENRQLLRAQGQLVQNLEAVGFKVDKRPYTPHVTLARKGEVPKGTDVNNLPPLPFLTMVEKLDLMESRWGGGRLVYTKIG